MITVAKLQQLLNKLDQTLEIVYDTSEYFNDYNNPNTKPYAIILHKEGYYVIINKDTYEYYTKEHPNVLSNFGEIICKID